MLVETIMEQNGSTYTPIDLHQCDSCGKYLSYLAPREEDGDKDYCGDCAFKQGRIDEQTYLDKYCYWIDIEGIRAAVHEGEIYIDNGNFPWERESSDRSFPEYIAWRTNVFERDQYTCQSCGQQGGKLNAHHKKPFSKYPELRTELSNGITLCVKCHKAVHRRKAAKEHERC